MGRAKHRNHYHVERDGRVLQGVHQRWRRAWELVATLARTAPTISTWRVFTCNAPVCTAPKESE